MTPPLKNSTSVRNAWLCEHTDKPVKAKGLCRHCYEVSRGVIKDFRRTKRLAWLCEHKDRPNHTRGLCRPCANLEKYHADVEKSREKSRQSKLRNPPNRAAERRKFKQQHPNYYIENKSTILLRMTCYKYGVSDSRLNEMFEEQGNKCCCGKEFGERFPVKVKRKWAVDHDHKCCDNKGKSRKTCGKCTRGLLCLRCNIVLGLMEEDHRLLPAHLQEYLRKYEGKI